MVDGGTNLRRETKREVILHEQEHSRDRNNLISSVFFLTLTGKSTTGTVRVTAVSTARRTISRITSES